jgi:2-haloacid dehalogenase
MPRICVFDVNETLLDLSALGPYFEHAFGDAGVRREWFQQVLQSASVATILGIYSPFDRIQSTALDMVAQRHGVQLAESDRTGILGGMRQLPPHSDVRASLERLRGAGLRLATLTNSPGPMAEAQLMNAGLRDVFERVLSVDAVQRLKPAGEVYRMAAQQLGVEPASIRLIAAHSWDVAGALHAGCAAAFVGRPGQVLDPLFPAPDIVGRDLHNVAELILEREGIVQTPGV